MYTCTNKKCLPDFAADEFYVEEYAFVQFSEDFSKVQYGTDEQIKKQQQEKAKQALEVIDENDLATEKDIEQAKK